MKEFLKELRKMVDQMALADEEISDWVKKSKTIESVTRLPGDASARRYYRIQANGQKYVVMKMEPFEEHGNSLPFLEMQRHLDKSGVEVPKVFDVDASRGFILLEDLGDVTLLRKLQDVSNSEVERHLYERAIDALVYLQVEASPAKGKKKKQSQEDLQAFGLRFDREKLMWEVNFTIDNFYKTYLKRVLSAKDSKVIQEGFGEICGTLAQERTVLTHRDYHSRNIMVTPAAKGEPERLVMIDFQDARMGPAQYDLSSLLKDSYYQLDEEQVSRLIDYYIARFEALSGMPVDRTGFHRLFDLMGVQRNFKAIGSFASFLNKRGDATYLKYIGNTFENIRRALLKYPEFARLREVLYHYYYF